ncbi:glycosidase [Brevundimonas sp. LM2]|uniref:DUF2840 domain-containing protein n=1 Tax=Brevundimonas sp. LM2 TaxID=1938605 RepID=UPI0009838CD4|nr:DUF2840 domain-containing protein [Brevundimonas sp. LM2]AQR61687.1 glycosidase [Brevundimonas sp. LM2]
MPVPTAITWVELVWVQDRIERWIRFGQAVDSRILDRRTRLIGFAPGAVFAVVRWAAPDVSPAPSRIDILQALPRGAARTVVPGVVPGGALLLSQTGWPRVQAVLAAIDGVEAAGVDPADAAPDWWRHVHNRLSVGERPRAYTLDRHRAWRLRRSLDDGILP